MQTTVFYVNVSNIESANQQMLEAVGKFNEWCLYNKLTINSKKSKCMLFSNKSIKLHDRIKEGINILINNIKLEIVGEYKYLGIILDENLNFSKHVNYLISLVSHRIYNLRKIRKYIDERIALILYKTMILNYFDLGMCSTIAATKLF